MENFTTEENLKLEKGKILFNVANLSKEQIAFILDRTIEQKSEEKTVKQKQKPNPKKQLKDDFYSLKLFEDEEKRTAKKIKKEKPKCRPEFNWKQIAQHAARKAQRKFDQKQNLTNDFHVPNIFRESYSAEKPYRIEKINEYHYEKFKTDRSEWKIFGHVDLYDVNKVIKDLIDKMTANLPDNVKLQIILHNIVENKVTQTNLLRKNEIVDELSEWVQIFIDYHDMEIENVTFKLLTIELPKGAGKRVNSIVSLDKKSIISVKNYDSICLARAIVVSLAVNNLEKFHQIFKNNLTTEQLKEINKGRKDNKTQINEGILSDNEIEYLKKAGKYKMF